MTMFRRSRRPLAAALVTLVSVPLILAASASAKTTVTVWFSWERAFIRDMVKRYNATHPNVEVKAQVSDDSGGSFAKLVTAMAAGSPPNCVLGWDDIIYEFASKGLITSVDDLVKQKRLDLGDYSSAALKAVTYKGKMYGIPLDWDPDHVLYLDKQRFSEAGLDWTRPPVFTDELENVASKLSVRDANGKYTKLGWVPWNGWLFWQIYWMGAFGGSTYDESANAVVLNSAKNVKAFDWLANYVAKYTYPVLASGAGAFGTGKGGMMTGGDWNIYSFPKKFEYAVARAPYARDAKSFLACSGWSYVIPKGAKNLAATHDFISWMTEPKQAAEFCKGISWLPASFKARQLPAISEDPNLKWFVKLTEGKDDAIWMDPSPVAKTIYAEAVKAGDLLVAGKKSAKDALDIAQRVSEIALKVANTRRVTK